MKVWIFSIHDASSGLQHQMRVFSTKEKAENYKNNWEKTGELNYFFALIRELEMDREE